MEENEKEIKLTIEASLNSKTILYQDGTMSLNLEDPNLKSFVISSLWLKEVIKDKIYDMEMKNATLLMQRKKQAYTNTLLKKFYGATEVLASLIQEGLNELGDTDLPESKIFSLQNNESNDELRISIPTTNISEGIGQDDNRS